MLNVKYEQFFDREAVLKAVDAKSHKVLRRQGAFYRTVVRRSMRSGGKPISWAKEAEQAMATRS